MKVKHNKDNPVIVDGYNVQTTVGINGLNNKYKGICTVSYNHSTDMVELSTLKGQSIYTIEVVSEREFNIIKD